MKMKLKRGFVLIFLVFIIFYIKEIQACTFTSVGWNISNADENEYIEAIVNGTNCDGQQINMTIWEDDLFFVEDPSDDPVRINPGLLTFSSGTARYTWKAEYQQDCLAGSCDPPEYYFKGYEVLNSSNVYISISLVWIFKDSIAPLLSNIQASPGSTSATITWTTNELSNSSVDSTGTDNGNNNLVLSHSIQLNGLSPSTNYIFTVTSCDQSFISNCATTPSLQFTTQSQSIVAPWWDTNYQYRKRINITNNMLTTLFSGNPVSVTLDHANLVSTGKSLSNGNDVRIVYYDGISNTELDRFNDLDFNKVNTGIWFKLQSNIISLGFDDNYWLYYGNNLAVNPPRNGNNVFWFFDDFLSTSINSSKWNSSGLTVGNSIANITTSPSYLASAIEVNTNQILSSKISVTDNITNDNPTWWFGFQCPASQPDCISGSIPWILFVKRDLNGMIREEHNDGVTPPFFGNNITINANQNYTYTIKWRPSNEVIWQRDKLNINTLSIGVINVPSVVKYKAFIYPGIIMTDWVFMANYSYPEPTFTLGTEEILPVNPQWSNNVTSPPSQATYNPSTLYLFNLTWMDPNGINSVFIEHNFTGTVVTQEVLPKYGDTYIYNFTGLGAGFYYWTEYAFDGASNSNQSALFYYTVNKAPSATSLFLNNQRSNLSVIYNVFNVLTNASGFTNAGSVSLYNNNVLVSNPQITRLGAGLYNYTAVSTGNQNYSSTSETWFLQVNQTTPIISLTLNEQDSDVSYSSPTVVSVNATKSTMQGNLTLYFNNLLISSGPANFSTSNLFGLGIYNYTLIYENTQNYSRSSVTHFIYIIDNIAPNWSGNKTLVNSYSDYVKNNFYQFNITWNDNVNVDKVLIEHNFDGALRNYTTLKNGNESYYNINDLAAGNYQYRWYANDTSGNLNVTGAYYYQINKSKNPSINLVFNPLSPINYGTQVNVSCYSDNPETMNTQLFRNLIDVTPENNNFVIIGANSYSYECRTPDTQNFTSSVYVSGYTVNQASNPVNLYLNSLVNQNIVIDYPQEINATGTNLVGIANLYRNNQDVTLENGLNVSLSAGVYSYKVNSTGNQNYTANGTGLTFTATINQGVSQVNLLLNSQDNNIKILPLSTINISAYLLNGIGPIKLFIDNILVANAISPVEYIAPFDTGIYNITMIYEGDQNYTRNFETHFLTVSRDFFNLTINQSINLISIPIVLDNNTILDIFKNNEVDIYSYDNNNWKVYHSNTSLPSNLQFIDPLKSYFVVSKTNFNLTLNGTINYANGTIPSIELNPGWNLIGINSLNSIKIDTLIASNLTSVFEFNGTDYRQLVNNVDYFFPGKGYWVNMLGYFRI